MGATWQTVRGTLIHRCVLHPAGKWFRLDHPSRRRRFREECDWMAQNLRTALSKHDDVLAWALVDAGGPYWTKTYDNFLGLSSGDRALVLQSLEVPVGAAAEAICIRASRDGWQECLSEIIDPYALLLGEGNPKKRIDLLTKRIARERNPLLTDLKTGKAAPDLRIIASLTENLKKEYGIRTANTLGMPVDCQILYVSFGGEAMWGPEITVAPDR